MQKRLSQYLIAAFVLAVFGGLALATQEEEKPAPKSNKDLCLECHGPFQKIIDAGVKFKITEEESVNPHRYIPHDTEEVPVCTECHLVDHKVPLEDKSTVVKPKDVDFCFASCHHMRNFQICSICH